jgi:hypothetical protein
MVGFVGFGLWLLQVCLWSSLMNFRFFCGFQLGISQSEKFKLLRWLFCCPEFWVWIGHRWIWKALQSKYWNKIWLWSLMQSPEKPNHPNWKFVLSSNFVPFILGDLSWTSASVNNLRVRVDFSALQEFNKVLCWVPWVWLGKLISLSSQPNEKKNLKQRYRRIVAEIIQNLSVHDSETWNDKLNLSFFLK